MGTEKRKTRGKKALLIGIVIGIAACAGLWIGVHKTSWMGPLFADSARKLVGPGPVAWLEDTVYGVEDGLKRLWMSDTSPQALWEVRNDTTLDAAQRSDSDNATTLDGGDQSDAFGADGTDIGKTARVFHPSGVGPMHKNWSAPGDGAWVSVPDSVGNRPGARMYKTLLHPDRARSWSAVTVVALDMERLDVHLVAGRWEPKASEREARDYKRTGLIPERDHPGLLAAFNGGFKYEHGRYGMRVDAITLVRARPHVCTIAKHANGRIEIGSWERFSQEHEQLVWWRQTPYCMWEQGKLHVGLRSDDATTWGATVDGDTVIRRSAIGVSEDGTTVYVGIGDSTTARSIAQAMHHAGAYEVAQLDVNWSFPKFVTFEKDKEKDELVAVPISSSFEYDSGDFIRKPYARDFFYVTEKKEQNQ